MPLRKTSLDGPAPLGPKWDEVEPVQISSGYDRVQSSSGDCDGAQPAVGMCVSDGSYADDGYDAGCTVCAGSMSGSRTGYLQLSSVLMD